MRSFLLPAGGAAAVAGAIAAVGLVPMATSVTALSSPPADGGPAAICAPVDVAGLQQADAAFLATVTSLDDTTVTMRVDTTFKGSVSRRAQIDYRPDEQIETSIGPVVVGQQVLVSALDNTVMTCGRSGPASPELTTLYTQAFR